MEPLLTSENPPVGTEPMSEDTVAWLCSINFLGTIAGSLFWGTVMDHMGRKNTSCLVSLPLILSWTLVLTAKNAEWLLFARFIAGIGTSGISVTVPPFISEIAQDDLRGTLGCFLTMFINLGVLFSYVVGAYFKYHILAFSCLMIPISYILIVIWFPETPMFLWRSGREKESQESLLWYRGGDRKETEKTLTKYKSIQIIHTTTPNFKSLISVRGTRKAFIIATSLMVSIQLSGFFSILSFSENIFKSCGTSFTPSQSAISTATVLFVFSCFCSVLVDRFGRKVLLVGTLIVLTLTLAALGLYLFLYDNRNEHSMLDLIPIVCICLHVTAFAMGLGPIHYVINGEIFPPEIRGYALSNVSLVNGVFAFTVLKLFPTLKAGLHLYGCFWFYSASCLFFAVFFSIYLPETKGKAQHEILNMLNRESPTNVMAKEQVKTRSSVVNEIFFIKCD